MNFYLKTLTSISLILGLIACQPSAQKNDPSKSSDSTEDISEVNPNKKMLVAYVAGYRDYDFSKINASKITHINYAFANIRDGEVIFDTTKIDGKNLTPKDIETLIELKEKNKDLKVLVSVGGWSWSKGFSDAAISDETRTKFANSCVKFIEKYKLDGIDLDWEYPNQTGAGNIHRPEDVQNFTLLLKEVRSALDEYSKQIKTEKRFLLSIATGADQAYVDNTELAEIHKYLDFLNIMTYDFYNGLHKTTGHHANLSASALPDMDMNSVENAVDMHINAGFPVSKINLGIPFYGRIWKGVKSKDSKILFQEAETVGMGIDYVDFYKNIDQNGFKRYWDDSAKAPYLWNETEKTFISYEDKKSIEYKIDYLKEKGLSGVMFWEYCADHNQYLFDVLTTALEE